jgi:peptide/nickel transport system substrate-binding protein
MRKSFVLVSLLVVLTMLLSACGTTEVATTTEPGTTTGTTTEAAALTSKDPTTFVQVTAGYIDTLDPALAYDTASGEILFNVYEGLVFFQGEEPAQYIPQLATEIPTVENGGISADGLTWTWKIREGVTFHNGDVLTPTDVAYSLQRGMLQGGSSSPQWLYYEAFFGTGTYDVAELVDPTGALDDDRAALAAVPAADLKAACEKVTAAVVADDAAGTVTFHLAQPWSPMIATLAQSWGSIMDKKWVAENGGWDGTCDTWQNYYGMVAADDPFSAIENGTGPYTITSITAGTEIDLAAYEGYWRTEPAYEGGPSGVPAIKTAIIKYVDEWGTRFSMLQTGDADVVYVPVENRSQADALVGEKCVWDAAANAYAECETVDDTQPLRLFIGRPAATQQDVILYNFAIPTADESPNAYIGSGKLDGNGIPSDFFADVHIRKAFSYCFDWDVFINDVYNGEAVQSTQLSMPGMNGYDENAPYYTMDLDKAAEEFKLADLDHDGIAAGDETDGTDIWAKGFYMVMLYNTGNTTRQIEDEIVAANLAAVNEKFQVSVLALPWPTYLAQMRKGVVPFFPAGWIEDIHDPSNWFQPYTAGTYGGRQNLPDDLKEQFIAKLIEATSATTPEAAAEAYYSINQMYYDLAVGIPLVIQTTHGYEQRWVNGLNRNPLFGANIYFYGITKN